MRVRPWMASACGTLLLMGCAGYQPRPLDPSSLHAQWQDRRLDDPSLRVALGKVLSSSDVTSWPPAAYGRAELLAVALVLNPELAEARAALAQALAGVTTAKALPNPTVSLALERYTQDQVGSAPWLWGITTDWLLDAGLRRTLREDAAQAAVRAARLDYAEKVWSVRQALRTALADLLFAQREQALATQTVQAATALDEALERRHAAGEVSSTERLQAAVALSQAQRTLSTATQRAADAQSRLAHAIGLPASALDGISLRWDDFDHPDVPPESRLNLAKDQALLSRTDLERALVDYDSREIELHQQIRAQYPLVSISPGYTYDHGLRKLQLGLSASLPILNQNQGPIAEAEARRDAAGHHVETVQASIQKDIDLAVTQTHLATRALDNARTEHATSTRMYQQVQLGNTLGADDRVALLQAQLANLAAAQTELAALAQSQQAQGALEDALRMPLDEAELKLSSQPWRGQP